MNTFLNFWQWLPYKINPVIFYILEVPVKYYGLSYILAFVITYGLLIYSTTKNVEFIVYKKHVDHLMTFIILGIFLGGRLGYVLFYGFDYYMRNPLEIFLPLDIYNGFVFKGFSGMSYHGGLIGAIITTFFYIRLNKLNFLKIMDLLISVAPLGYFFGRLGNFLNGELYGRPTSLFVGMYFPNDSICTLRHPSQLYEGFFEGIILFLFLQFIKNKKLIKGKLLWIYFISYGIIRFFIEYLRQPDLHIGYFLFYHSLGQILCFIMVVIGFLMFFKKS